MVLVELERQEDDLHVWAAAKPEMFIDLDEAQQRSRWRDAAGWWWCPKNGGQAT